MARIFASPPAPPQEVADFIQNKSILITGGTGSFGQAFCRYVSQHFEPARLIVYSRDELKQYEMQSREEFKKPWMRFFLGDVRDRDRMIRAMDGVDFVIHAAALKQVPAAEYNPHEFIKTNINGATNVVDAALAARVSKVIALSTDKAVNPINLYGATKLCADKIFVAANSYRGPQRPGGFSVVRYGNVVGSRGSVFPLFLRQKKEGRITVTDPNMTRFLLSVEDGVAFVLQHLVSAQGGEILIPKLYATSLQRIIDVICPECEVVPIGIRPGEKMHEVLIPEDESLNAIEFEQHFVLAPTLPFWNSSKLAVGGKRAKERFSYDSHSSQDPTPETLIRQYANRSAQQLGLDYQF